MKSQPTTAAGLHSCPVTPPNLQIPPPPAQLSPDGANLAAVGVLAPSRASHRDQKETKHKAWPRLYRHTQFQAEHRAEQDTEMAHLETGVPLQRRDGEGRGRRSLWIMPSFYSFPECHIITQRVDIFIYLVQLAGRVCVATLPPTVQHGVPTFSKLCTAPRTEET